MVIKNHVSGSRLKVELIDLPFAGERQFRVRVNGQWARKVPVASKTIVARQVRTWLVKHWEGEGSQGAVCRNKLAPHYIGKRFVAVVSFARHRGARQRRKGES
jgi:hypothetical protein